MESVDKKYENIVSIFTIDDLTEDNCDALGFLAPDGTFFETEWAGHYAAAIDIVDYRGYKTNLWDEDDKREYLDITKFTYCNGEPYDSLDYESFLTNQWNYIRINCITDYIVHYPRKISHEQRDFLQKMLTMNGHISWL